MGSENTGSVRTAVNVGWLAAIAWALDRFTQVEVDVSDPTFVAVAVVVAGVFYRLSRVISDRWKWVGYVLFGINTPPQYMLPPPPPPEPDADAGYSLIEVGFLVLALAFAFYIFVLATR